MNEDFRREIELLKKTKVDKTEKYWAKGYYENLEFEVIPLTSLVGTGEMSVGISWDDKDYIYYTLGIISDDFPPLRVHRTNKITHETEIIDDDNLCLLERRFYYFDEDLGYIYVGPKYDETSTKMAIYDFKHKTLIQTNIPAITTNSDAIFTKDLHNGDFYYYTYASDVLTVKKFNGTEWEDLSLEVPVADIITASKEIKGTPRLFFFKNNKIDFMVTDDTDYAYKYIVSSEIYYGGQMAFTFSGFKAPVGGISFTGSDNKKLAGTGKCITTQQYGSDMCFINFKENYYCILPRSSNNSNFSYSLNGDGGLLRMYSLNDVKGTYTTLCAICYLKIKQVRNRVSKLEKQNKLNILESGSNIYLTTAKYQTLEISEATTINIPDLCSNSLNVTEIHLFVKQGNTLYNITFETGIHWQNGEIPEMTANSTCEYIFTYINGNWYGRGVKYS